MDIDKDLILGGIETKANLNKFLDFLNLLSILDEMELHVAKNALFEYFEHADRREQEEVYFKDDLSYSHDVDSCLYWENTLEGEDFWLDVQEQMDYWADEYYNEHEANPLGAHYRRRTKKDD